MNCHNCEGGVSVPLFVYKSEITHRNQTEIRLWILVWFLTAALIISNIGWLSYESQFETTITTKKIIQDSKNGTNLYVDGDMYGETNHNNYNKEENT